MLGVDDRGRVVAQARREQLRAPSVDAHHPAREVARVVRVEAVHAPLHVAEVVADEEAVAIEDRQHGPKGTLPVVATDPLRVAIIAPCWFAVPPVGYGGIERIVALLADGLVDKGHDVTLFASGGSRTRATLVSPHPEPPSSRIGLSNPALEHALACLVRADEFDVINDHSGALAAALLGLAAPDARLSHRARPADGRGRPHLPRHRERQPADRPDLAVALAAHAGRRPAVARQLPERARPRALPPGRRQGRLRAVPRPHGAGEGPGAGDPRGARARPRDPARRQAAGHRGDRPLRRRGAAVARPGRRVPRRGLARREGRAAAAGSRDDLPDLLARAVRPRDDRVDGLRHAGRGDALRRGARGARGRRRGRHRRRRARPRRRASSGRSTLSGADARDVAVRRFSPGRMVDDYARAFSALLAE